ncbi:MAG TPA: ATP-dependent helicase HrpB [Steroidobacter sp.]|nr:ATP-dependent helicase HrpB [Steroidobacteraceae bacterium]HLS82882.1 ATP-dependent helicase HrpB [Steroidobacter sp.]
MTDRSVNLPIDDVLPALREAFGAHRNVVLQAPPGAGKSTGAPLALLHEPWLGERKIVMLEPRRLAARAVARRMAWLLGEPVGATVGYRTRLESKVGRETRIEVVTEGILTRRLQRDPALEDVALVIFDEFHERSLNADLGLALCLDAQGALREDLRILVMSATIDGAGVASLLGDAPLLSAPGRAFEVETRWYEPPGGRSSSAASQGLRPEQIAERRMLSALRRALEEEPGDVLAFLPGQGEIRRLQRMLEEQGLPRGVRVAPLYGELAGDDQDAAIRPSAPGERKIVLATNIAETSLTIEGVRVVIDAGLARRSRFDPASGMSRLETVRISRASADQRRGRAGRIAAGVCYRLWTESEHAALAAQAPPEIVEADLAPLALELANWGVSDPRMLRWLDLPPAATFAQARDLLRALEALDDAGRITDHGKAIARIGAHPRLAHMIVRAAQSGIARHALDIAAVLGERDLLRFAATERHVDLRSRIDVLRGGSPPTGAQVDAAARQRALRAADLLGRQIEHSNQRGAAAASADVGRLLALAYPDRLAQNRGGGRFLLSSGRGAQLPAGQSLASEQFLVVADLEAGARDATIRLAAPIERAALETQFADRIEHRQRLEWDSRSQAVLAQDERWLGALLLGERRIERPDSARAVAAMLTGVRELGLSVLPWTKEARALQARIEFARRSGVRAAAPWPDVSDATLQDQLERWLAPYLGDMSRRDHLARLDMHGILLAMLDWGQQQRLNEAAPTHFTAPSGSRIPIDYCAEQPTAAVRLQEMFGLQRTPMVGDGRTPVILHLLSPAHRPVQVTQDLASFWARAYADVKKELKGRYPKHHWPDDPLTAIPTARAKRRGR